jgi:Zn-dependent M28 family amino/carboxypeptidase
MKFFIVFFFVFKTSASISQLSPDSIPATEIEKHIKFLASDSMKGRGNYTIELNRCARYIANQFEKHGLQKPDIFNSYFQAFAFKKPIKKRLKDTSEQSLAKNALINVVAILPGKSRAMEVVLFSAHYDHLGSDVAARRKRIYNGANDNASGIAALLYLAKYYALKNDNERTLVFCAFSGEEIGLFGSEAFANVFNTSMIKLVLNFDMVGLPQGRKHSFFITGANRSDLSQILKNTIPKDRIVIRQEPAEEKQFYERSDNYSFAVKGVVAHSIMTTDDEDPCYHKPCDDIERIDCNNLKDILDAIVLGCATIVSGHETPK